MDLWCRSNITFQCMECLVHCGLLNMRTMAEEWLLSDEEDVPSPPDRYVVSFTHFHESGFSTPAHRFLRGCCTTTRSKCSILIPMGSSTWRRSLPCARGSWGSAPTLICGGTSSPSPSKRRGSRAVGKSCTCRWGAPATSSRIIGSASTRRCSYQHQTRGGTCSESTSKMPPPPLCRSSPGA